MTDTFEAQAQPFRRIVTDDLGRLISRCLNAMKIAEEKKGSKTMLFRHIAICILGYLAGELYALHCIALQHTASCMKCYLQSCTQAVLKGLCLLQ